MLPIVLDEEQCDKDLDSGYYVLNSTFTYEKHVNIKASQDVNIILKDDCTLTARSIFLEGNAKLTIYDQSKGTGRIEVHGDKECAGIRVSAGATLNIIGGNIEATGGEKAAGIGGGEGNIFRLGAYGGGQVYIYGGNVVAKGGSYGAGIGGGDKGNGGNINIYGGNVTATGGKEAAGIGCGNEGNTSNGKTEITIEGGRVTATGGKYAAGIGCGDGGGRKDKGVPVTVNINGGTIHGDSGKGADNIGDGDNTEGCTITTTGGNIKGYSNHEITLEGITEKVQVVGINADCIYGINDVYTFADDASTLHFNMLDTEYAKLTEITIKYQDKTEQIYLKDKDNPHLFKPKPKTEVNITGVKAQNGIYNGLSQQGYTGTPTTEGYDGEYNITYYLSNGEKTTPDNSGSDGEGTAPVYVGDYMVSFAIPKTSEYYFGSYELQFKIEKATPKVVEQPTLTGDSKTAVKTTRIEGGVANFANVAVEGVWTVTDERGRDILEVGTKESYEVTFTPIDTRNYNSVTTKVVPEVIEIPTLAAPTVSASFNKNNREKLIENLIEKLKEKISDPKFKDKFSNPEFRNKVKDDIKNSTLIKDSTKKEILKKLLSNNPELKDKAIDKITNSDIIKDDAVRVKLLSFIEE